MKRWSGFVKTGGCAELFSARTLKSWLAVALVALAVQAQAAEGFSVKDMAGKTHALSAYKGKWVVVNYWATWCPPCLEEIPDLIALHETRKDLAVIGIALEYDNAREVARFVDDNLMSYPVVLGDDKVTAQIGPASVLPTTYIYNPQGKLVKTKRGMITRKDVEQVISEK
ncbi:MAG TPA: TlpA disulfide reductase family protein [Methylophilaceae bacterium]|nr:TlpA disulfide reductase family protein [Methylophilaceae bacterium]